MADHAEDDHNGDIFVYRGGQAPQHVTHVIIDKSVDEIEKNAFLHCDRLWKVETHDGIRRVGKSAFWCRTSLPQINLKSAVEIGNSAFYLCKNLADVEFGDELETIERFAFGLCTSLEHLKLPSIITIEAGAFSCCTRLINVELSEERLETIGPCAFRQCRNLQRIAIPLKRDLFVFDDGYLRYSQFDGCDALATVNLVGGIHKTVASLHIDSWRTDMLAEINRINQVLPSTPAANDKTNEIAQWMESVVDKIDQYKAEHCRYVNEGITLLELALWKAKLVEIEKEENCGEGRTKKARVDAESSRKGKRVTCGADIVIKNVLPFLQLE